MLRGLIKHTRRFDSLNLVSTKFDDVALIKKTSGITSMRVFFKRWDFPNTDQLSLVKEKLMAEEPTVHKVEFFDIDNIEFHDFSPLYHLAEEDFIMRINGIYHVCYINSKMNFDELFHNDKSLEDAKIDELVNSTNKNGVARRALAETVTYIIQQMYEDPTQGVKDIIKEKLLKDTVYFEKKRNLYESVQKTLQSSLTKKQDIHKTLLTINDKKAKRRIKLLSAFILFQAVFTQYGTYVSYSWDIMEPIVCFFGTIDMFFAYLFWYIHEKDFNYISMYQIGRNKVLEKDAQLNEMKRYEYELLSDIVKKKSSIYSPDVLDVIDAYANAYDDEVVLSDDENNDDTECASYN